MLTFSIQDPKRQIRDLEDLRAEDGRIPLSGANFAIGVWAGTRYARARLVSSTDKSRLYQLAIPKTASVKLFLETALNVVDAMGQAIATRKTANTLSAGGQPEVVVNLTIQ